jgi:hypothetical protein
MKKENIFDSENNFPDVTKSLQKLSKTEVPYLFEEKLFALLTQPQQSSNSLWDKIINSFLFVPSTASITVASVIFLLLMVNERIAYTNPFSEMPRVRNDIVEVTEETPTEFGNVNDEAGSNVKSKRVVNSHNSNNLAMKNELVGFKLISSTDEEKKMIDSLKNSIHTNYTIMTVKPE